MPRCSRLPRGEEPRPLDESVFPLVSRLLGFPNLTRLTQEQLGLFWALRRLPLVVFANMVEHTREHGSSVSKELATVSAPKGKIDENTEPIQCPARRDVTTQLASSRLDPGRLRYQNGAPYNRVAASGAALQPYRGEARRGEAVLWGRALRVYSTVSLEPHPYWVSGKHQWPFLSYFHQYLPPLAPHLSLPSPPPPPSPPTARPTR